MEINAGSVFALKSTLYWWHEERQGVEVTITTCRVTRVTPWEIEYEVVNSRHLEDPHPCRDGERPRAGRIAKAMARRMLASGRIAYVTSYIDRGFGACFNSVTVN